jgi:hypothetical protein
MFAGAFLLLSAMQVAAQSPIGELTEVVNEVDIDAFGSGDFIPARAGEALYESSVIRTGYNSFAYGVVDDAEFTIGPYATTPVASFRSGRQRGSGDGFFSRILRGLTRSLAPPVEEEIVGGGRADQQEPAAPGWMTTQVDPDTLLKNGITHIDDQEWRLAVETLRLIEYPEDLDEYTIEEYYVQLTYALMGLGDFHAAMGAAFEYALAPAEPAEVSLLTTRLQLLAGLSAFYAGEDAVAEASLDAYLSEVPLEAASPEAVAARVRLLSTQGATVSANRLLRDARQAQPGTDWDSLLSD